MRNQWASVSVLYSRIMYDCRCVWMSALLFHRVDQIKTVSDGTVRVRPAGSAVLTHFQHIMVLDRGREKQKGKTVIVLIFIYIKKTVYSCVCVYVTCGHCTVKSCTKSLSSLDKHRCSSPTYDTVKPSKFIGWSLLGQKTQDCPSTLWQKQENMFFSVCLNIVIVAIQNTCGCVCVCCTWQCVSCRRTTKCVLCSRIILQKSATVLLRGVWLTMNSLLWWCPCGKTPATSNHQPMFSSWKEQKSPLMKLEQIVVQLSHRDVGGVDVPCGVCFWSCQTHSWSFHCTKKHRDMSQQYNT